MMQVTDEMVREAAIAIAIADGKNLMWPAYADHARAALTAALAAMWRPIEEAPKDGSSILTLAIADRAYHGVAQWAEADEDLDSVEGWFWPFAIRPTHFMPLPSPPKAEG